MKFINFILETNIYISTAALLLTIQTQLQLGMTPQWHPYLFIGFFATMFEYNFHRLVTIFMKKEALENEKNRWLKQHLKLFYTMVFLSVIGFIIAIMFAKIEVLIALIPIALLTIFYSFPLFKMRNFIFRLREIPLLKIFLIAFVWSAVTIFLPVLHSEKMFLNSELVWMFIERFVFVFAITIPFDIRDIAIDKLSKVITIPILVGANRSIQISLYALLIFAVICLFHYMDTNTMFLLPAFLLSALSSMIIIANRTIQRQKNYHYGIVDGTLLLQGLLSLFFYFVF